MHTKAETVQAILLFFYVLLSSAAIIGIVRHLSDSFHTFQVVLCYNGFALACLLPWLLRGGTRTLKTDKLKLFSLRAILEFVSFSFSFYALSQIPLPTHTALLFVTPIFGTIIALVILKERPTLYSYVCIACGFVGVLIITRPGVEAFSVGILAALMAAVGFACCGNVIKLLTRTEPSIRIAFYMLSMSTVISLPFGLYHWNAPEPMQWLWLTVIGVLGFTQQLAVAKALSKVPYTTIIPLNFSQLVFVSIIAYVFFGEVIDQWTLAGAVLIIGGTLYNAYQSSRRSIPVAALPPEC